MGDGIYNGLLGSRNTSGGSSGGSFTNLNPMPVSHGGFASGSTFNAVSFQDMFNGILYPFQVPAFTSYLISGQGVSLEVGDSVTAGLKTFNWTTSNPANIQSNSIDIKDVTGATTLATGLANDGTEPITIGAVTKTTNTSNVWSIEATDTQATLFSRNFTVNWFWKLYYGESPNATLTEFQVEALRVNSLTNTIVATYAFLAGGYKYIAHETSLGTLTTFKDTATQLGVPFEAPVIMPITNAFGQLTNYKIYRSTNILGSSINIAAS